MAAMNATCPAHLNQLDNTSPYINAMNKTNQKATPVFHYLFIYLFLLQVCRSLTTSLSMRMPEFDHRPAQASRIRGRESGIGPGFF